MADYMLIMSFGWHNPCFMRGRGDYESASQFDTNLDTGTNCCNWIIACPVIWTSSELSADEQRLR